MDFMPITVPSSLDGIHVRIETWRNAQAHATPLRMQVFVDEQAVPAEIEIDEFDPLSEHALAFDRDGKLIATGRLLPDGHIGRMAVAAPWRGRGVGRLVLLALMERARDRGMREAVLNAQIQAAPFYAKSGFTPNGEPFDDAGIAHIEMRRTL